MLSITGDLLSTEDKRFIRYATVYTLDYLMPNVDSSEYRISINIGPKGDRDCQAECVSYPRSKKKKADVWVNETFVRDRFRTVFHRFDNVFFSYFFHELVHVKQYFLQELKDLKNGRYKFKGIVYKVPKDDDEEGYYLSPYEMEARAYEEWLWVRFRNHLNQVRGL